MEETIPKTSGKGNQFSKPWFDDECHLAVSNRNNALDNFRLNINDDNKIEYKRFQAIVKKVVNTSKRNSWHNYISSLGNQASLKKTWDMIRKISGKNETSTSHHLQDNGSWITERKDIANVLGSTYKRTFSSNNYSEDFKQFKIIEEQNEIDFDSTNDETYNQQFSLRELKNAIAKSNDTSPGPDDIHYQILKKLPETTLLTLLDIINSLWEKGECPEIWKDAFIVPIPKPNKDNTLPQNYRPISLTSCLCKTFERMVNERLVWYLEHNKLLSNIQSGFRKNRTTQDHLIRLESFIREAFIKNQHVVSIFFDMEKAYDTAWKHGVMKDLHHLGLRGHLPKFITAYLNDRRFRVRLGTTLSEFFDQEEGYPQGGILSVTLFMIKINSIIECIKANIDPSLFVDDFSISCAGKSMNFIERQIQHCVNALIKWADRNGFKFSQQKTVGIHFCNKRITHPDPIVFLKDTRIPIVPETKFLGIIFDRKLSFIPHIKHLKLKCQRALNLLRVVSGKSWGADRETKLTLYRALIRSKLDYGCMVYGSARKSYLQMLEPIQTQALRICLNAFRSSPKESLHVEANEQPLYIRRIKLSMQYAVKLYSNQTNPTHDIVFNPKCEEEFSNRPTAIPSFGIRIAEHIENSRIHLQYISPIKVSDIPPWKLKQPAVITQLSETTKQNTYPDEYKEKFERIRRNWPGFKEIYTDGSKLNEQASSAMVTENNIFSKRLPDYASIFSAEVEALQMALRYIQISAQKQFMIFVDSKSVLEAISNINLDNPKIVAFLQLHHEVAKDNTIVFCWIPSHIGIVGNEKADKAAKEALNMEPTELLLPNSDFKPNIKQYARALWQLEWDSNTGNKLRQIQSLVGKQQPKLSSIRDDMVIRRARIGHTNITHKFLMVNADPPVCATCNVQLTVNHILIDCRVNQAIRSQYYSEQTLKELFKNERYSEVINFLKEIDMYYKF